MGLHEECGVFGVMGKKTEPMAELVYYGLYALQHRGQESCGIVVNDDGVFSSYKDLGLISEVFSKEVLISGGNHGSRSCKIRNHRRQYQEELSAH